VELSKKQTEAFELATSGEKDVILYGGAIRGGKTYWLLTTFCYLASTYANSRWVIVRESLPTLKRTTLVSFQALLSEGLDVYVKSFNRDTYTVTFRNGSQIIFMAESFDTDKELNRFRGLEINGAGAEEINELQEATFHKLIERTGTWLKAGDVPAVILATCNPTHNWVKTRFYDAWKEGTLPKRWSYIQAKITDNPFIPESYLQSLKDNMLPNDYQRFVEGDWEVIEVNNRFATNWDDKYVVDDIYIKENEILYVSMDFNVEPFGFIYYQAYQDSKGFHFHILDEETINEGSINQAARQIEFKYYPWIHNMIITGDYNGNARTLSNGSYYEQLSRELKIPMRNIQTSANPQHKKSRNDLNYVLYHHPDFKIHKRCESTIRDLRFVEANGEGGLVKENRKNIHERADHMDCLRYAVNHKAVSDWIKFNQAIRG